MFNTHNNQGMSPEFSILDIALNKTTNSLVQVVDIIHRGGRPHYSVVTLVERMNMEIPEGELEQFKDILTYSLTIRGMIPQILIDYLVENKDYSILISDGLLIVNCTQVKFKTLYEEYLKPETYFKIIDTKINKYE